MRITLDLPLSADGVRGELPDGSPFLIRPIRASDGAALATAFSALSARSKYLRFFTIRDILGDELTKQLTDIDHDSHRAWVVVDPNEPSDVGSDEGRGVAVARLVQVDGEDKVAEAALAVVDDHQGRGYGRLLLDLLIGTARDTGIEFMRFETLAENRGMRALLRELNAVPNKTLSDREVLVFDVPVDDTHDSDAVAVGALYEILRWIAADS